MPNWCVQNWILKGPKDDVQRFCDTVNTCLTQPDVMPNDFGKYWLGNLCVAFGYEYSESTYGLRGNFDPNGDQIATLCCPIPDETPVAPTPVDDDTAEIRFSVTHAHGRSDWFEKMVDEKFPDLKVAWKATDEFGNFHTCRNGEAFGLKRFEAETWGDNGEDRDFDNAFDAAAYLNEFTSKTDADFDKFTPEEVELQDQSFWNKLNDWNERHDDDFIGFCKWEAA